MEKLKLLNNMEFNLVPFSGINQNNKELEIQLITDESLDNLHNIFSDINNLKTIKIVSEDNEEVGILTGYINLKEITRKKNVFLYKREISKDIQDDNTEPIINDIQDDNTELITNDIQDVYGDIIIIKLNTLDIENTIKQIQEELETTQEAILELSQN